MQKRQKCLSVATLMTALFLSLSTLAQFGGGPPPDMQGGDRNMPTPPDPEKMVDQEVKWMKKKLKLSPEQTEKVADISTKYAIAQSDLMQKIMGKGRPSEKAMQQVKAQMDQMMKDKDKEMSLVLDPKQFEKYLKRREDATQNLNQNNNRNGNGGPPSGDFPGGGRGGF